MGKQFGKRQNQELSNTNVSTGILAKEKKQKDIEMKE